MELIEVHLLGSGMNLMHAVAMWIWQGGSPLDQAFTNLYNDVTGVWPKLIGSVSIGVAYLGHRHSDTDGMMHKMWPMFIGIGLLAWAPSVYQWLF
jgi:hypothetical protein